MLNFRLKFLLFALSFFVVNSVFGAVPADPITKEADHIINCQVQDNSFGADDIGVINDIPTSPTWVIPRENGTAILGLVEAYIYSSQTKYKDASLLAANYLRNRQESDGAWCFHYDEKFDTIIDKDKSPSTTASVIMAFYKIWKMGWDPTSSYYSSMKLGAQYILDCISNKGGTANGLVGSGKEYNTSYPNSDALGKYRWGSWSWGSDNSYAYIALMCARDWASSKGETAFANQCYSAAMDILSGINIYLKNLSTPVWYRVVDGNGNTISASTAIDQLCYYPQKLDIPVSNYSNPTIADWMTNNLQVNTGTISSGYGSYIWTPDNNNEGNRRSQGYAEEAWLVLSDIHSTTATNSMNRAKTWWEANDNTGGNGQLWNISAGGIVDWYDPDTGATASSLERFIDTSANCIFVYRGGYNHNLSSMNDTADHLIVTTTSTGVIAERRFKVKIQVVNANNAPIFYKGLITFSASTNKINLPSDYTFIDSDAGEHNFYITATNSGYCTIIVQSTTNSNIQGSVKVYVNPPSSEYYVATGGNDGNPGSFAQPFRTLAHAADVVQAGDTVYVFGGTFDVGGIDKTAYVDSLGLPDAPIVFKPYTNSVNLNGNGAPIFEITNTSYIRIQGFNMWNSSPHGILVMRSDNVVISNIEVSACANYGISVLQSDKVTVISNKIHDVGWGSTIEGPSGILFNNSSTGKILFNKCWTNSWHGIRLEYGSVHTLVYGNETWKNDKNGIIVVNGCNDITVKSNISYRSINENEIYVFNSQNVYVGKNKVHNGYWNGIQVQGGSWNIFIKNNECYSNRDGGIATWANSGYVEITSNQIYNDNVSGGANEGIRLIMSGNILCKDNEIYGHAGSGIDIDSATNTEIIVRDNNIHNNGTAALDAEDCGILVNSWNSGNCKNVKLINNSVSNNYNGITLHGVSTLITILSNRICYSTRVDWNDGSAIHLGAGGNNTIAYNSIHDNQCTAIQIWSANNKIGHNIIYGNGMGGSTDGAVVIRNNNNVITNNVVFKHFSRGITISGVPRTGNTIRNCTVVSNISDGIVLTTDGGNDIRNSISIGNGGVSTASANSFGYNDEVPAGLGGTGSISQNPLILSMTPTATNFMCLDTSAPSPCIDAGDPSTPVPIGGGTAIDMGAFEAIYDITLDHFKIAHRTNATVGIWTNITITAESNSLIDWNYTGTISVYIIGGTENNISWQNGSGQGVFTPNITNSSRFTYTFSTSDSGSVSFKIIDTRQETINIEVKSGTITDDNTEGNLNFFWGELQLTSAFPASGAQNVSLTPNIYLGFNNILDSSTVNANTVYLLDSSWNKVSVSNTIQSNSITLTPVGTLQPNEFYTVVVTTNIFDNQATPKNLTSETQFSFTTIIGSETFHQYHSVSLGANNDWSNSINVTYDNTLGENIVSDTGNSGADPYQIWATWDANNLYLRILRTAKSSVEWCDYLAIDTTRNNQGASSMPSIAIGGETPVRTFYNNRKPEHLFIFGHEDGAGPGGSDWVADAGKAGVFFQRYQWIGSTWGSAINVDGNVYYDSVSGDGDDFIEIELPWATFGGVPNRLAFSVYTRNLDSSVDYYCPDNSYSASNWVTIDPDNNGDDVPDGFIILPTVDHYEIIHDGSSPVNVFEPITIRAIQSSGQILQSCISSITLYAVPGYSGTITWTTNTNGNYGTFTDLGSGKALYTFNTNDKGIVTLRVSDNMGEDIDPEVVDDKGNLDNDTPPQYITFTTSGVQLQISKSISNVTLDGTPSKPVPGSMILYKIWCSNSSPGNATDVLIYDKLPANVSFKTGSSVASPLWKIEFSTNLNPDQSFFSTDYSTNTPSSSIQWLRWKSTNLSGHQKSIFLYNVFIK